MEFERVTEHVGDLVPVHDPGPGRPRGVLRPVVEMIHEDADKIQSKSYRREKGFLVLINKRNERSPYFSCLSDWERY